MPTLPAARRTRRRRNGDLAERLAAEYLRGLGWTLIGADIVVGRDELDLLAVEPGGALARGVAAETLVFVEVRSHSTGLFGAPEESVGPRKLRALYRAALGLVHAGALPDGTPLPSIPWRLDLLAVDLYPELAEGAGGTRLRHLRGLTAE